LSKLLPRLLTWATALAVPIVLVFVGLRAVTAPWFVRWEYGKAGFPADPYGLSNEERISLATVCVDYLARSRDLSVLEELRLPDGAPAFNERELQHMDDVQTVFDGITVAGSVAALVVVGSLVALSTSKGWRPHVPVALRRGSLITIGLLVAVGVYMALSWDQFFTNFHRVFFEGDSWLFRYSDTLIRLFPMRFWIDVAATLVGTVIIGALLTGAAGWWRGRASPP
jgi:integral membrane protein (TIGR01906 family)